MAVKRASVSGGTDEDAANKQNDASDSQTGDGEGAELHGEGGQVMGAEGDAGNEGSKEGDNEGAGEDAKNEEGIVKTSSVQVASAAKAQVPAMGKLTSNEDANAKINKALRDAPNDNARAHMKESIMPSTGTQVPRKAGGIGDIPEFRNLNDFLAHTRVGETAYALWVHDPADSADNRWIEDHKDDLASGRIKRRDMPASYWATAHQSAPVVVHTDSTPYYAFSG